MGPFLTAAFNFSTVTVNFGDSSDCLFPIVFLSQAPLNRRWEFELFDGLFINAKFSNLSEFFLNTEIVDSNSPLIHDSPIYGDKKIHRKNDMEVSPGSFLFKNDFMAFRYLNVMCAFYVPNRSEFIFDLEISSIPEKARNWRERAKTFMDDIQKDENISKQDISGLLENQPDAVQSFVLEPGKQRAFLLHELQKINISCEIEVVHSIYLQRGDERIIWVEEVESTIDYDFSERFDTLIVLFIAGKADENYELKLATLDLLLQLNLDTSVDQATSLLGNFIGLVLIGLYSIIRKLREHCAKKKRISNASLSTNHIRFNESNQNQTNRDIDLNDHPKKSGSSQNSDLELTNSKSNSMSGSNHSEHVVINQHYNLPEAFRQR